jgi:hypothetical protein
MPKYIPLAYGYQVQASRSDLVDLSWRPVGIAADFVIPVDAALLLRVSFDRPCIVRLLDEMALGTEDDDDPAIGQVSEHFAYEVEGASFARTQSEAWKVAYGPVTHFRFVTGLTCMDVLSAARPVFRLARGGAVAG